jgi:hypothetical protein
MEGLTRFVKYIPQDQRHIKLTQRTGASLICHGECGEGETEVTANKNHHTDKEEQSCSRGTQSYCCLGFMPPITKEQVEDNIKNKANDLALEVAEGSGTCCNSIVQNRYHCSSDTSIIHPIYR